MAEPASEITPLTTDQGRCDERTHLFVAAALYIRGCSCPVHIRNISRSGAMIEGAVLPEQGGVAILRRGRLEAEIRVIWVAGRKAGVAFSSNVFVGDWLARTQPTHQGRVDEMVRSIRAGTLVEQDSMKAPASPAIEAELRSLRKELSDLENGLLEDAIVTATHPEIQLLDIALQRVDRLLRAV